MDDLRKIEAIITTMETVPLSSIIPRVLPWALMCKDYLGFCVLSLWNCSLAEDPKVNAIQHNEIVRTLALHGVDSEVARKVYQEAIEEYLAMKTISSDAISSHSAKEIETWLSEVEMFLAKNDGPQPEKIKKLVDRQFQIKKLYEILRSFIVAKLSSYYELVRINGEQKCMSNEKNKCFSKVFIVHGHNGEMKEAVARLIEKQGIQAIILHEQANMGATIIEKFERNSDVSGAVCLFTADDLGRAKYDTEDKKRARQNVVFEAGYFIGKLGRQSVILIADKGVEIPSDLQGVVYTDSQNWRFSVLQELKAIGYNIDYNKID